MADFKKAHEFVAKWEGFYSNDPDDSGGETIYGISRVHHPNWEGWILVDEGKKDSIALKEMAEKLYRLRYWGPLNLEQVSNQRLATVVYQAGVNCGVSTAAKWLQQSLNAFGAKLDIDGKVGNHTLHAIYERDKKGTLSEIVEAFLTHQKMRYYTLAQDGKDKFLKGWLNRVSALEMV